MDTIRDIEAIDVHGHYGNYLSATPTLGDRFRSADLGTIVSRAQQARTAITIVSPFQALVPRGNNDPVGANEDAAQRVCEYAALRFYVVLDPRHEETFRQAEAMLKLPNCAGIKIHPEEHVYPIREHGHAIFEFAQKHGGLILTHSGEENSLPEDFVPFTDEFSDVRLILAHLGCGYDGDLSHQVRAIQKTRSTNVFVDTSSAQSLTPNLIEWAVQEIGAQKILYGTDTPLYCTTMQRVRIDEAEMSDDAKRLILRDNALRLFGWATTAL